MRIGRLNKSITVQSQTSTQGASGGESVAWTPFATVWASIDDVSGREFMAASGTQNAVQTKIVIRLISGVLPTMRVLHGSDIYNIEAVLKQHDDALLLMCSKGVVSG